MLTFKQIEPHLHKWAKYFRNKRFQHWELINAVWEMGWVQKLDRIQFASARIKYDMIEYMRNETGFRRVELPKTYSFSSVDEELTIEKIIGINDGCFGQVETKDLFEFLLKGLPCKAKLAVHLRYECNYAQSEIAKVIGVSSSRISQILSKALKIIEQKALDLCEIDSRAKKGKKQYRYMSVAQKRSVA